MSNIKNKQHYVFQAYLKNWCKEDDKLWVFNKKDGKIFSSGTINILNKRRLLQLKSAAGRVVAQLLWQIFTFHFAG